MSTLGIIDQLAATTKTTEKLEILSNHINNDTLKAVFYYAYNPRIKYWIKKRIDFNSSESPELTLINVLSLVETHISSRVVAGQRAISFVQDLLSRTDSRNAEILLRVIERDLKCGVNVKLINKVWNNLIPEYPVLLCSKYNEKTKKNIKYPAIFQLKSDGGRINLEFDDGKFVSATTRNGNVLDFTHFDDLMISCSERIILDGELLWRYPNGKTAPRKVSNGYVTKAVRGTITPEEAKGLYVNVWDYIPYDDFLNEKCEIPYLTRFEMIKDLITEENSEVIKLIESEIVHSEEEVMEKYHRNLENGEEGGILKSVDGIWEAKRSKYQLKLKAEDPVDLLVVGFEYGKTGTKYEKLLGSLICETSCGKLRVNVGSGLKDHERIDPESYIGKIIEVKFNEVISSKGSDIKSLFLPIFVKIRTDKDSANSLEEIE
jgi:ATP-dependent DNA ligase